MEIAEFIKKVKERTGTQDDQKAHLYISAVFNELRDRISPGGASNLAAQLPKDLRDIWEPGLLHNVVHSIEGVEHIHLGEFLGHIQNGARLADGDEAEMITRAVFMTLEEQISRGEIHAVANQLPEDIRKLWMESAPSEGFYTSEAIGPAAAEVFRTDDQIREEIEYLLEANDEVDESTIDIHVEQGNVRLSGIVRSELEREEAKHAAKLALGVVEVQDDLQMQRD